MKAFHVALLSCLGMFGVGGAVFAVTPEGGFGATAERPSASEGADDSSSSSVGSTDAQGPTKQTGSTFLAGTTVQLEGRVGHSALLASNPDETYVMLEVRGDDKASGPPAVAALSIVIDKSGSMRGTRFANALNAAVTAVERLRDGDSVSVVAFDTRSEKVVPLTTINSSTRQNIISTIRNIQLGGDTCISCGIEEGLGDLRSASATNTSIVQRMILLSDGATNNGIRDIPGFKSLGQRAMSQGVNITTIGVDVEFDEKVMSAIASSSNGRHYFVENDVDLVRVFDTEAANVVAAVASNTVAEIELASGVELVRVFDRSFSRNGSRISIPLGAFSKGELKTVLVKVKIPKGKEVALTVANIHLGYRDLASERDASLTGKLSIQLVDDKDDVAPVDAIVLDRLQRSETATALREANNLFSVGKADEARRRLEKQSQALASARPLATAAPASRAGDIDRSFQKQEEELNRSKDGFATPPPAVAGAAPNEPSPAPRAQKAAVKRGNEQADAFSE